MRKSLCCVTVRAIVCDLFLAVTFVLAIGFETGTTLGIAASGEYRPDFCMIFRNQG